jgi:hypothetical protein
MENDQYYNILEYKRCGNGSVRKVDHTSWWSVWCIVVYDVSIPYHG